MKIVMTLLVRDEEDVLDTHIRYHLNQGVDYIIATDNLSTDGSTDILRAYEREGHLRLLFERDDDYSQSTWVTRMARLACVEYGADWIINSDADEFWWPHSGDLRSALGAAPRAAGIITVPRTNYIPRPEHPGTALEGMVIREIHSVNSLGEPLSPKVCHRARPDIEVMQGNHDVRSSALTRLEGFEPLLIHHFPIRSYARFENKIRNGGQAYHRNKTLPPTTGTTWRNLHGLYQQGGLRRYFDAQVLTEAQIKQGISEGTLVEDRRLTSYLDRMPHPVLSPAKNAVWRRSPLQGKGGLSSKVFGVGWARTGTTTLGQSLRMLGFDHQGPRLDLVRHMKTGNMDAILALAREKQSFDDWPWTLLYRMLDEEFAGSRFILTRRQPDRWLRSYRNMLRNQGEGSDELNEIRRTLYGLPFPGVTDDQLLDRYVSHNADVLLCFKDRPGSLLVVDWEAGDGWRELCDFLHVQAPPVPFPHENRAAYAPPC